MKVTHVHKIAGIGGSERHLLTLLPALAVRGIDVRFVGLDADGADPFYEQLAVPFVRLSSPLRLRRALRASDVVHTHLVHADVFGALAAGRVPLVSTKHNDDRFRLGPYRVVERAITRRARRLIAITESLKRFCVDRVGLPAEKIEVIRYGLDEPPRPWGENPPLELPDGPLVAAVSRLVPQKGIDVAVRAMAGWDSGTLVVLGKGPEQGNLTSLAQELGVRLVLPGHVPDVAAVLRRADVFVHPARWEGFGLAVLEAMLCGLPVVATRVSAIPEIVVGGETGVLVPPDDPDALRDALQRVLADPGRLGEAGRERAHAEFSVERMAQRTAELYARIA